jgi:glycosyltransferase involved in cell wall biosynthesis
MIGIYCHHTSCFQRNTGIQRCLRATARALAEQGEAIVPLVWAQAKNGLGLANKASCEHLARWSGPGPQAWRLQAPPPGSWLLVVELISGLHQPPQTWLRRLADRCGWRLAAVFHDAIPLGWGGDAAKYHGAYMAGLAQYDLVLATSATTLVDLQSFWHQQLLEVRARLEALPLAAEIPGTLRQRPQPPAPGRLPGNPLRMLCVGSLEPRKNHRALLQALAWLQAQGQLHTSTQLVGWANDPRVLAQVQRAQALGLPLHWDGEATDEALLAHYAACDFTVYPSLQEGFGMPVQESLWQGRPCLTGQAPALLEQAQGGGCLVVDTSRWQGLAQAIASLQHQPQQLDQLAHQLLARPLRSWADYATAMLSLMHSTAT